jgi:hypothetical protein
VTEQRPPVCGKAPELRPTDPHLGLHAFSMPVAPLGYCDGGRTIDRQAGLGAELQQAGIAVGSEFRPTLKVYLAARQVVLAGAAGAASAARLLS